MDIEFKNGSKVHTIPTALTSVSSRRKTYPLNFIKNFYLDIWDNLHLYQKLFIVKDCAINEIKGKYGSYGTYRCAVCGEKIPKPQFAIGGRGCGKTGTILKHNVRECCCSDECFVRCWNDLVGEIIETEKRD